MPRKYLDRYNDVLVFLIVIPLINTINYHLTYARIRWDWYTYATYVIDTVQGYIAWWLIRKTVLWLDRKFPYMPNPSRRIALQVILSNLLALGFIILATEGVNALYTDKPLPSKFYTYNLFIFFIWILVINGIYIGMYFYNQWHETTALRETERKLRALGFEVRSGKTVRTIPFNEIAALVVEDGITFLKTRTEQHFVMDSSLNKLMDRLPMEYFYRLNRKYIVHREFIRGYQRGVNGKIYAEMETGTGLPPKITISRLTAPHFKEWFRATLQGA